MKKTGATELHHLQGAAQTRKFGSQFFCTLPSLDSVHKTVSGGTNCVLCSCPIDRFQCRTRPSTSAARFNAIRSRSERDYPSTGFQFHSVYIPQSTHSPTASTATKRESEWPTTEMDDGGSMTGSLKSLLVSKSSAFGRSASCTQLTNSSLGGMDLDDSSKR
ncbi:hypothetical protein D915_003349 [Fasciola hepatica]|uniref:Uncharacterized protein n=1 Tax=Fasciola hepatica TaxID=6192 RepID=A0A4E0S0Q8_FASHE|nr:hypothetical protein D915_003349 [Fasciola hepatica]